jgi:hypothetical protein
MLIIFKLIMFSRFHAPYISYSAAIAWRFMHWLVGYLLVEKVSGNVNETMWLKSEIASGNAVLSVSPIAQQSACQEALVCVSARFLTG